MKGVAAATHMLLCGILRAARAIAYALIGGNKWRSGTNLMVNGLWSGWERSSATEGTFLFRNFVRLFRNFVSRQSQIQPAPGGHYTQTQPPGRPRSAAG